MLAFLDDKSLKKLPKTNIIGRRKKKGGLGDNPFGFLKGLFGYSPFVNLQFPSQRIPVPFKPLERHVSIKLREWSFPQSAAAMGKTCSLTFQG